MDNFDFSVLPRVNTQAINHSAVIRSRVEDFQVEEFLPFEADGSGGHAWLQIQKTSTNTDWLASSLAKFAGVPLVAIGYAGMKDRHAVTTQWFSINLEGYNEPDWPQFENKQIKILTITHHARKLKRGVLAGNRFNLLLRDLRGKPADIEAALTRIKQQGVPNYFGEQRFGHQGANIRMAEHWFQTGRSPRSRNKKSLYLSAIRSWLFNLVLAKRIDCGNWNQPLTGEVMLLAGTRASHFVADNVNEEIVRRAAEMDIHPTGPLWGRGRPICTAQAAEFEDQLLNSTLNWCQSLEKYGLKQERRSLRVIPEDFEWQQPQTGQLQLTFKLPPGSYATAVLRELAVIIDSKNGTLQYPDPSH